MGRPSESKVNEALAVLREMADRVTTRQEGGYEVADIPPLTGRFHRSLTGHVAGVLSAPVGSVGKHLAVLINAGFLQPGSQGARQPRWVRLEGDFSYEDK